MINLTVLGSGTLQPTPSRGCSGYLLKIDNSTILLDSGSGTLRQLSLCSVLAEDIDYIFFSHLHVDHTADLIPLLFAKRHASRHNKKNISIYGPRGFKVFFEKLSQLFQTSIEPISYKINVFEYELKEFDFSNFSVTFMHVQHTENSCGFRIQDTHNTLFAYTGDTDYCDNLIALCKDCDIAVIECSFPDDAKVSGHMVPYEVGKIAQEAGCKRVLLTHMYPNTDKSELIASCKRYFDGEIAVAEDLHTYTFGKNS